MKHQHIELPDGKQAIRRWNEHTIPPRWEYWDSLSVGGFEALDKDNSDYLSPTVARKPAGHSADVYEDKWERLGKPIKILKERFVSSSPIIEPEAVNGKGDSEVADITPPPISSQSGADMGHSALDDIGRKCRDDDGVKYGPSGSSVVSDFDLEQSIKFKAKKAFTLFKVELASATFDTINVDPQNENLELVFRGLKKRLERAVSDYEEEVKSTYQIDVRL
jgi:hypothetical protein